MSSSYLAHRFRSAIPPLGAVGERARNHLDRLVVGRLLRRLARRELVRLATDADLVYVPWPHRLEWVGVQRPVVCTIQDTVLLEFPEILGGLEAQREVSSIANWLRCSAQVIVSSESSRSALWRLYGQIASEVRVVPHAIVPDKLGGSDPALRESAQVLIQRLPARYIACLTNITSHKNVEMLMIAWSRFAGRRETPLVVTGLGTECLDETRSWSMNLGWQQDRLSGLMRRLGLQRNVDVIGLGYVPDEVIEPVLRRAMALISPSLSEGGGSYPVEEALALSVPVLCSDIPVMREHLAQRQDSVVWFDPMSVTSMVEALETFVARYPVYKAAAEQASRAPRPSWAQVASAYVDVFESVLGPRARVGLGVCS